MLTIIATANNQYSRTIANLSGAWDYCSKKEDPNKLCGLQCVEILNKRANRFVHGRVISSSNMARFIRSLCVT